MRQGAKDLVCGGKSDCKKLFEQLGRGGQWQRGSNMRRTRGSSRSNQLTRIPEEAIILDAEDIRMEEQREDEMARERQAQMLLEEEDHDAQMDDAEQLFSDGNKYRW
mmetsp:Transcript_10670/g.27352  ORF Transcript_10670/g.27352 Transcript_10670/m.27352 type:complete len:107 (-) Transcript_10670:68-388(-)